ncbi:hypothetical protein [Paenibacillus contaminans]|uniref:Pilus assembly protein n=1 Tax=Paenibacillus contaminans TaxID=450362 RepID=A0A329MRM7_9BACL|nr:hypothetical protein [Paenibacillus contaminans]RAV20597.1 hypothetical protein DQG23_13865 [Paenibacillus contaminans]
MSESVKNGDSPGSGRLFHCEEGSYTLEASLIYPAVFVGTLLLLALGLVVYDRAALTQTAALTAERTAFNWGNSYKDASTGAAPLGAGDGLYWRVADDGMFGLLRFSNHAQRTAVLLPDEAASQEDGIVKRKLRQAGQSLPGGLRGELSYTNAWIKRSVQVRLSGIMRIPNRIAFWRLRETPSSGGSSALVSDPVELIRTVDLTRTYIERLRQSLATGSAIDQLEEQIESDPSVAEPFSIRSEAEAAAYLLKTIGGKTVYFETDTVGQRRKVDVLDNDGIAHEAKFTLNSADARLQLLKDVELMRKGMVKGVVWHFFRTKNGKISLSNKLRQELEQNGIIVIVHN